MTNVIGLLTCFIIKFTEHQVRHWRNRDSGKIQGAIGGSQCYAKNAVNFP